MIAAKPFSEEELALISSQWKRIEEETLARAEKRRAEIEASGEEVTIRVRAGAGGQDARAFAQMLRDMYHLWGTRNRLEVTRVRGGVAIRGPGALRLLDEGGVMRLVLLSPFDNEGRRCTCFAAVSVNGKTPNVQKRSYTFDPYTLAVDHITGAQIEDAPGVLRGLLDDILSEVTR